MHDSALHLPRESGVYAIIHASTGKRYVGSAVNLKARMKQHFSTLRGARHHSQYLQRAWTKHGEKAFLVSVLELCDQPDLLVREQVHIDAGTDYNILPLAGRTTGYVPTKATRAKISKAMKGRPHSAEHRANIGKAHKGRIQSPAFYAGRALANTGRKNTPETIQKMRDAHTGKKFTAEHKAKIGAKSKARMLGHRHSEETKAKMRASHLGQKRSAETCRLISENKKQWHATRKALLVS